MIEAEHITVTGFPNHQLARHVIEEVLQQASDPQVWCIVDPSHREQADAKLAELAPEHRERVRFLEGDPGSIDLGLSGPEYLELAKHVGTIHHCASLRDPRIDRRYAEHVNLNGLREALELAETAAHLRRVVFWSTAHVSGAREGRIHEEDLVAPARFHNVVEETLFRAERVAREAMAHLPITVLRPAMLIGDSHTGHIDNLEGPYLWAMIMLSTPPDLHVPLPGPGKGPMNAVPVDYAAKAGVYVSHLEGSVGRTFHLVDAEPPSARWVFEKIAEAAGRPPPRSHVPAQVAQAVLNVPLLGRLVHGPRSFLQQLETQAVHDDRCTREALEGTDITPPRLVDSLHPMVEHVRQRQAQRRAARAADETWDDPLE